MSAKKQETTVSAAVIKRLPRYFRYLRMLLNENKLRISSNELAERMNVTASQIRQDLNCFGGFGQQGYGYNVTYLYGKISEILGVNENYQAIIIGAGKLGQALAVSPVFSKRGVKKSSDRILTASQFSTKKKSRNSAKSTALISQFLPFPQVRRITLPSVLPPAE